MTFNPTPEQQEALRLFATGKSLAIEAGAGTGKTSTLKLLAESAPHRRGQYLAFNKAIVEESKAKMPGTVRCNTAHSAAFRVMVKRLNMDRLRSGRMKSWDIARFLGISNGIGITNQDGEYRSLSQSFLAGLTMRSVTRFCQSADPEPGARHVPYVKGIDVPGTYENNSRLAGELRPYLRKAWDDLMRRDGALPFTHDHYLKAWQLDNPRIETDYILFDEAQDANPVMVDIVARQRGHAQLVWVGDSQQQIYTFTGAVNALQTVGAEQTAFLTQSFRFGPAVADVANRVLAQIDGAKLRLRGHEPIQSTVGPVDTPDAILTRTNAEAVRNVLEAQRAGKRAHLVGGGADIVSFAKAAQTLMDGGRTEHPELACFDTWNDVLEYVEQDEQGGDLRLLVKLIGEFTVPVILAALDNMVPEARADVVVSTAHKSKGREWDQVQLGADFPDAPEEEELRLLYVAVTRAKMRLDHSAVKILDLFRERPAADDDEAQDELDEEDRLAMAEVAHDDPEHDHASCPDCIREAREAEHEAEGQCAPPAAVSGPQEAGEGESYEVYTGRASGPVKVPALVAVDHALEVFKRTGRKVTVLDSRGELVVEFDR
jgi:hypothetical protein